MGSALVSLLRTDDLADFFLLPSAPNGRLGRKHSRGGPNSRTWSLTAAAHRTPPSTEVQGTETFVVLPFLQGLLWDPSVSPQPVKKPGQLLLYIGKSNPQSLDAVLLGQDADLEGHIIALDMTYSKETFIPSYVW